MKRNHMLLVGLGIVGAAIVYATATTGTLSIAGSSVETNFITQNNRVYVPLADVAKALKYGLQKSGTGYDLSPAGGANQVTGLHGKIGDVVNLGFATVKVVKVVKGEHYAKLFTEGTVDALDDKQQIVAIVMRVKNATKEPLTLDPFGGDETALVDNEDHSFQAYTGLAADVSDRGPKLLPGAAYDFALVFPVPKSAEVSEFVYGVKFYDGNNPKKTVRISLKES